MADLSDVLEQAARRTATQRYARARAQEKDPASFRFTTDQLKNLAKAEPQYVPYYNEFLKRDKAPQYSMDELAATAPAFVPKKVAAAILTPTAGQEYTGTSTDSESIIPGYSVQYKKPAKATGATGATGPPPKPQPQTPQPQTPRPQTPSPNDPDQAFRTFMNTWKQGGTSDFGDDWKDRAANTAESLQNQFHGEPQLTGYHWNAGSGGLQGGNNAGMIAHFSDGTTKWIDTNKPGEIPAPLPTTLDAQKALLASGQTQGSGGGILPAWNSPTGQNVDLRSYGPKEVDTSAAGPLPPSGWLDRAIAASRSGATTYNTGAELGSGNFGKGDVEPGRFATPSGGSIGTGLMNAINQSRSIDEKQKKADQYQLGGA